MKLAMLVTSALRRVCPQGLLLAGPIVASVPGLQAAVTSNQTGTNNGFYYSYWRSGGSQWLPIAGRSRVGICRVEAI